MVLKKSITYLDDQAAFDEWVASVDKPKIVGFDTEFIGEKRYMPELYLIQISVRPQEAILLDPKALDKLTAIQDWLRDPEVVVVTHAGENDFRVLHHTFNVLPCNVFDTQIAAAFLGFRYPVPLHELLRKFLQVRIGKSATITDWSKRPLDAYQMDYAAEDVLYLLQLYEEMQSALKKLERVSWVEEECEILGRKGFYEREELKSLAKDRVFKSLSSECKLLCVRLAYWREEEAKRRNQPIERFFPMHWITEASRLMQHQSTLSTSRLLPETAVKRLQPVIYEFMKLPMQKDEQEVMMNLEIEKDSDPVFAGNTELLLNALKVYCAQNQIAYDILLKGKTGKLLKDDKHFWPEVFNQGWRSGFLGDYWKTFLRNRGDVLVNFNNDSIVIPRPI